MVKRWKQQPVSGDDQHLARELRVRKRFVRARRIRDALLGADLVAPRLEGSVWLTRGRFPSRAAILCLTESKLVLIEHLPLGRTRVLEVPRQSIESLTQRNDGVDITLKTTQGVERCHLRGWFGREAAAKTPLRMPADELLDVLEEWRRSA